MIGFRYKGRLELKAALVLFVLVLRLPGQSEQALAEQSRQAKGLMSEGRFDDAANLYRGLVKALPANAGLLLNLGLAEQMGGHPERAIPRFEAVLNVQPNSIPALLSLSMSRLQINQPAEAVGPLRKVVKLDPKNTDACGMLAGANMSIGNFVEASEQYRFLTGLSPTDPKAWYGLGKAYESLAASNFDRLSQLDAQSAYVAFLLAESRVQQLQYRSAFFFYRQAEQHAPELPGLHAGFALVYSATQHPDWAALEEKREANVSAKACLTPASMACRFLKDEFLITAKAAASAANSSSLFWVTRAYGALARQAFEHLESLPESIELHAIKAQMLHDHRQDLEASKEWKSALALSPGASDARLRTELARSLFLARDYESAMPLLKELLSTDLDSPDLNFMLGESLSRSQQAETALPYLENALKLDPAMLPAHAALGLALVSLNKHAEAIPHLEKAVSLDDDGSLHYSLARADQSTGKPELANQNMKAYRTIQAKNARVNSEVAHESEITAPKPE